MRLPKIDAKGSARHIMILHAAVVPASFFR